MAGVVAYACIPELEGGGKDSKIAGTFQPLSLVESTRDPVSRNKVMSMFEEDRKINIRLTHTHTPVQTHERVCIHIKKKGK